MSREQRRSKLNASFFGSVTLPADSSLDPTSETPVISAALNQIDIVPNFNPRQYLNDDAFTPQALEGLQESIQEYGVLQPLSVRREAGRFKLIAGERRLRAARQAGLDKILIRILDVDETQALKLAIIENSQREDVDVVSETLLGFELLSKHTGLPQDEVVAYLNAVRKGRQEDIHNVEALLRSTYGTGISLWAQRRALVLKMNDTERNAIRAKQVEVAVCAELVSLGNQPKRAALLARAITEKLSAPQVRELVKAQHLQGEAPPALSERVAELRKQLGKIVKLKGKEAAQAETLMRRLAALVAD